MKKLIPFLLAAVALLAAATSAVVDHYSTADLAAMQEKLAAAHQTFKSESLKQYKGHYTMLAHREGTGSSEIHEHEADLFVIEDGEGTLLRGGTLVHPREEKPGELRGTSIAGGERVHYAPGDIIHIPAGVPHQMLVEKGKHVTYFVMKVQGQ
jgi:mannose-6-phosphate isomerase-like protein (cupin superfamily)